MLYVFMHANRNWERPDEFIPERWLTDEHKLLTTEAAYFGCGEIADTTTFLPFFTGSRYEAYRSTRSLLKLDACRNCVGIYLALLEMRIILKLALRKLHFSPVYIREEGDFGEQSVTLKPTWGRWAYVKERSLS
jgi:cytochrome P450